MQLCLPGISRHCEGDCTGQWPDTIQVSLCGSDLHNIHNQAVQALSLHADRLMRIGNPTARRVFGQLVLGNGNIGFMDFSLRPVLLGP
jgi:hypothetical protein